MDDNLTAQPQDQTGSVFGSISPASDNAQTALYTDSGATSTNSSGADARDAIADAYQNPGEPAQENTQTENQQTTTTYVAPEGSQGVITSDYGNVSSGDQFLPPQQQNADSQLGYTLQQPDPTQPYAVQPQLSQNGDSIGASNMIAEANNILITVSKNPSIDELSAAIGLTLVLDKAGKKVTAVYSGRTPHAIAFLDPDNAFQDNVSSLRDFIISLDKTKADRLRYKVDNDSGMVKIFVTAADTRKDGQ